MITSDEAQRFAEQWIADWNTHDLERVLSHYAENVEMSSPFIAQMVPRSKGTLRGKKALRAYWGEALQKFPRLRLELIDVAASANSICISYRSVLRLRVIEYHKFDGRGLIVSAAAHYRELS